MRASKRPRVKLLPGISTYHFTVERTTVKLTSQTNARLTTNIDNVGGETTEGGKGSLKEADAIKFYTTIKPHYEGWFEA